MYNQTTGLKYKLTLSDDGTIVELYHSQEELTTFLQELDIDYNSINNEILLDLLETTTCELIELSKKLFTLKTANQTTLIKKLRKKLIDKETKLENDIVFGTILTRQIKIHNLK